MGVIETALIMMAALFKILKIFIFLCTFFSKCFANECYQEGKTWVKENQLLVVENADLRQCAAAFLACDRDDCIDDGLYETASGFTWKNHNGNKDIGDCILYRDNDKQNQTCQNCISVYYNDDLKCGTEGKCKIEDNNVLSKSDEDNDFMCYIKCLAMENCNHYTWYSYNPHADPNYSEMCYFFNSCEVDSTPCDQSYSKGCVVGSVDFDILPPDDPTPIPPINECYKEGVTWLDENKKGNVTNLNLRQCAEKFSGLKSQNDDVGDGFTWTERNESEELGECQMFENREGLGTKTCEDCISVLYNDDLICTQTTGQCKSEGDNFISLLESDNDFVCYLKCLSTESCFFYTWYTSGVNSDTCFFFSSCDTTSECNNEECVTGSIDFYVLNPPTTPAPTTTPSSPATTTDPKTTTNPTTTASSPATTTDP